MMRPQITSVQNPRIKEAVKLRDRRQREKQQKFVIDGVREIQRAATGGIEIVEVFVCEELCHTPDCRALLERFRAEQVPLQHCTEEVFEKLAFGDRREGVLAVARTPKRTLSELQVSEDSVIAVLVGLEKPGNVGAVLRSADAAGVAAVIVADAASDLFNPNCIRASLGTVFTKAVCAASSAEVLKWLRAKRIKLFAARVNAEVEYTQADFCGASAIMLGSESTGLPSEWAADDIVGIKLPMLGVADSLNVSATAAVLFYEALRKRRQ
jgi:TrmH family RNA methyltransferase